MRGDEPISAGNLWTAPDGSDWVLTFRFATIAGRTECVGFAIESDDSVPLRAQTLRALKFAAELDHARQRELARNERLIDLARRLGGRSPILETQSLVLADGKPRQRARYSTGDYKRVAAVYRGFWEAGCQSPTRDTAEALGLRPDQAAKLVQRSRRLGFLPQTERGVANGSTGEGKESDAEAGG